MASLKRTSRAVAARLDAERRQAEEQSAFSERIRRTMLAREVSRVLARSLDSSASVPAGSACPAKDDAGEARPAKKEEAAAQKPTAASAKPAGNVKAEAPARGAASSESASPETGSGAPTVREAAKPRATVPAAPSLAARARELKFRLAAEEAAEPEARLPYRVQVLADRVRRLADIAPAVVYKNGKIVPERKPESTEAEQTPSSAYTCSAQTSADAPTKDEPAEQVAKPGTADSEAAKKDDEALGKAGTTDTAAPTAKKEAAPEKADEADKAEQKADAEESSDAEKDAAPDSDEEQADAPSRRRKWPWLVGAAVVLAGAYIGTAAGTANTVPEGTVVAGVDIGGVRPATAISKLEKQLGPKAETPVVLTLGDSPADASVDPVDYELALDAKATVAKVTGFDLKPASVLAHLAGGGTLEPVITYDEDKLAILIEKLQEQVDGGYTNATVAFEGLNPTVVPAAAGLGIDTPATHKALTVDLLGGDGTVTLKPVTMDPQVSDEEAAAALEKYAKPLVAAPVTISFNGKDIEASPEALAEAASFPPVKGTPELELDGARLAQVVLDTNPEGIVYGEDAKIEIIDHSRVQITPSTEGIGIDEDKLSADVAEAIASGSRKVTAETAVSQARFTTEDAEAMGVTEIVSEVDTPITYEYLRTLNLEAGAAKTTGTLVRPGETFSLLGTLGPIDTAHGFYAAGMIIGGQHKDGVGGGLSQISTNTFNLGYRAGYEDVEHHPHSFYFDRYPEGVESTLAVPTLDMRWRNNTPYGAVIDTWVADGYVHSRLWSTKYWNVDIQTSERRNVVPSGWNTVVSYSCEYSPRGNPGFTVTVTRNVSRDGEETKTDSNVVTYEADHGTRCVTPKPKVTAAPKAPAQSSDSAPAAEAPAAPEPAAPAPEAPAE